MLILHLPTLLGFGTALSASLGVVLLWLWRRDPSQEVLRSWGVARLLTAAAMPVMLARGATPDTLTVSLGTGLVCLAYGMVWHGARRFDGRPAPWGTVAAGAVGWLLACQVPGFVGTTEWRGTVVSLIAASYCGAAALAFHRGQASAPLPSRPLVTVLMGMVSVTYLSYPPLVLMLPLRATDSGPPGTVWFGAVTGLGLLFMTAAAVLIVALTKERAQHRTTAAMAAARDAAAEASAHKTRFLATMSHELRTPLNAIFGMAQVLARDPGLAAAQRRQAATIESAGRHLLELLNETLDLSRIEAGRLVLAPAPVSPAGIAEEALGLQADPAAAAGVGLSLVLAEDLPAAVLADRLRLRQILLNLLGNAVRFTPAGGAVTLEVAVAPGGLLRFAVTDTGAGVPASLRPQLFQPFAQATPDPSGGTSGLGLAISARLAAAMGGSLQHQDGPDGRGSRFLLSLPLRVAAGAPAQPMPAAPPGASAFLPPGLRILLGGEAAARRAARGLLEAGGQLVEEAADPAAALVAAAAGPLPDVVLLAEAPAPDSARLAAAIRRLPAPAGAVPLVVVLAPAAAAVAGADARVAAPLARAALASGIAAALRRAGLRAAMAEPEGTARGGA